MTTILESIWGISYYIAKNFIQSNFMYVQLFQSLGFFLVISPYVFLMNTSHNKHRIVESGWKNVIKNSIGCSNKAVVKIDNDSESKGAVQNKMTIKSIRSKASKESSKESNKSLRPEDNLGKNDIFIISKFATNHLSNETNKELKLHTPVDLEPSTSEGSSGGVLRRHYCSSDDENDMPKIENIQDIIHTQILTLIDSLENERLYLECFKILVEIKKDRGYGEYKLNSNNRWYSDENPSRKFYQTTKAKIVSNSNKRFCNKIEERLNEESDYTIPKLKGHAPERTILRKEVLDHLESCYDKHEEFNVLLERLIDIEESFIV